MSNDFGWSEAISAFVGAGFAFAVDSVREWLSVRREEKDKCYRALLTLTQMFAGLQNIWNQIYKEAVEEAAKHHATPTPIHVMPLAEMPASSLSAGVPELAFLMRTNAPDLPNRLAFLETSFHGHLANENIRSRLHLEMQGKLEQKGFGHGKQISPQEAAEICGPALWAQLSNLTQFQIELIPQTIADIQEFQENFLDVVKFEFPLSRFARFQLAVLEPGKNFRPFSAPRVAWWRRFVRALVSKARGIKATATSDVPKP